MRQHNRVPGTRTGRAAIWPGPFPVGFPLHRAPGWGQGHSPSSQAQKAWVLRGRGTATQVPRSQGSCSQWLASQVHRRWCPGRAKLLAAEGVGGRVGPGSGEQSRPQAAQMDARVPENALQTGRGGMRHTGTHLVTPPPHVPRMNMGRFRRGRHRHRPQAWSPNTFHPLRAAGIGKYQGLQAPPCPPPPPALLACH